MPRVAGGGLVLILATAAVAVMAGGCSRSAAQAPGGWKLTTDPTGSCQVSTPPDWQIGREFFLQKEPADIRETARGKQAFPPRGLALWQTGRGDQTKPVPTGKRFQVRHAHVRGEEACSVWRIKPETDFTAEERALMAKVGQTLQWVR